MTKPSPFIFKDGRWTASVTFGTAQSKGLWNTVPKPKA